MTKEQKRITIAVFGLLGLVVLVRRASAKAAPKGEVFIGPVTVTPLGTTPGDREIARLTRLIEKARALLYTTAESEEPDRRPSSADQLVLASVVVELEKAAYPAIPNALSPEQKQGFGRQAEMLRREIAAAMALPVS